MIRSLYIRVVLIFLISVIVGSFIAYSLAVWIYNEKLNANTQALLMNFGQDIVRIYDSLSAADADRYISDMKQLDSYHLRRYDSNGLVKSYGDPGKSVPRVITKEQVSQVRHGGIVQMNSGGVSPVLLGLPLQTDGGTQALFIEPRTPPSATFAKQWMLSFLVYFLLTGSVLILFASYFLIRPINQLTNATKRIAAGDFHVQLPIRQSGEIGMLARSFEAMTRELGQLEQMRRDFVANVSHEVQSPLTSISGYALALQQPNLPEADRKRYLQIIIDEAKRMSNLTDGLLKLSHLESQTKPLNMRNLSLDELIRRVLVSLQPQWAARDIQFALDLPDTQIIADYDLLHQVWHNLIGNAIKFSPTKSRIAITIESTNDEVIVSIADNGIGISTDDQARIFERFFKADRSHQRTQPGSGMGLAIVKQIVSLHQGSISVQSASGTGTTLVVRLPLRPLAT